MATINLGRIKPVWQGAWNSSTQYVAEDIVQYNNHAWVATTTSVNSAPADGNSNWDLMARGSVIPDQTGNSGKVLLTDGTNISWGDSNNASALTIGTLSQDRFAAGSIVNVEYKPSVASGRSYYSYGSGWTYYTNPACSAYTAKRSDTDLIVTAHITGQIDGTHVGAQIQYSVNGGSWVTSQTTSAHGAWTIPWGSNTNNCHNSSSVGLVPNSAYSAGDSIAFRIALYSPQAGTVAFGGNIANWSSLNFQQGQWELTEVIR